MPEVSVVLPVHNRSESLSSAVRSVLDQSLKACELIIVDDGSEQDVARALGPIMDESAIKVVRHQTNKGASAARNTGIAQARADYVAFIDSDDKWHPRKLERQVGWMISERIPVSCTGYQVFTPFHPEGERRIAQPCVRFDDLLWGCSLSPGSTMVVEAKLLEEVGPFDPTLRRLEDLDWLLRCARRQPIRVRQEVLAEIRTSPREFYPLDNVRRASARIRDYSGSERYSLTRQQRRTLLSTLHTEIAAAAFRKRQYVSAATEMLAALTLRPMRSIDYTRIFRALVSEVTHRPRKESGES